MIKAKELVLVFGIVRSVSSYAQLTFVYVWQLLLQLVTKAVMSRSRHVAVCILELYYAGPVYMLNL